MRCSALARCHSGVGVVHGWQPISGAFKVTEGDGNRIISLDWIPAFEVYRQVVESHAGASFAGSSFVIWPKPTRLVLPNWVRRW